MRNNAAKTMSLCGVTAALAVVIMCMGGLIPVATYVCPMLCIMLLRSILPVVGRKMAWVWYAAVSMLSLLLGPDKEAAAVFAFLGYYPIVKPKLDHLPLRWLWKGLLFNLSVVIMYWLLMHLFGMTALTAEFEEMGSLMLAITLILGNVTFFLLDMLLSRRLRRKH